jgi:hypothetical protein
MDSERAFGSARQVRGADDSKSAMFASDEKLKRRGEQARPHVVMIEGCAGVGKADVIARLTKLGFCVPTFDSFHKTLLNTIATRKHTATYGHGMGSGVGGISLDELQDAEDAYESQYYRALKIAWARDVFRARGKVIFVAGHPLISRYVSSRCTQQLSTDAADAKELTLARAQVRRSGRVCMQSHAPPPLVATSGRI